MIGLGMAWVCDEADRIWDESDQTIRFWGRARDGKIRMIVWHHL